MPRLGSRVPASCTRRKQDRPACTRAVPCKGTYRTSPVESHPKSDRRAPANSLSPTTVPKLFPLQSAWDVPVGAIVGTGLANAVQAYPQFMRRVVDSLFGSQETVPVSTPVSYTGHPASHLDTTCNGALYPERQSLVFQEHYIRVTLLSAEIGPIKKQAVAFAEMILMSPDTLGTSAEMDLEIVDAASGTSRSASAG